MPKLKKNHYLKSVGAGRSDKFERLRLDGIQFVGVVAKDPVFKKRINFSDLIPVLSAHFENRCSFGLLCIINLKEGGGYRAQWILFSLRMKRSRFVSQHSQELLS